MSNIIYNLTDGSTISKRLYTNKKAFRITEGLFYKECVILISQRQ
jgi:hypothetical protein